MHPVFLWVLIVFHMWHILPLCVGHVYQGHCGSLFISKMEWEFLKQHKTEQFGRQWRNVSKKEASICFKLAMFTVKLNREQRISIQYVHIYVYTIYKVYGVCVCVCSCLYFTLIFLFNPTMSLISLSYPLNLLIFIFTVIQIDAVTYEGIETCDCRVPHSFYLHVSNMFSVTFNIHNHFYNQFKVLIVYITYPETSSIITQFIFNFLPPPKKKCQCICKKFGNSAISLTIFSFGDHKNHKVRQKVFCSIEVGVQEHTVSHCSTQRW